MEQAKRRWRGFVKRIGARGLAGVSLFIPRVTSAQPSPFFSSGVAVPVVSYEGHAAGVPIRGGVDVPLFGGLRHRMRVSGDFVRFAASGAQIVLVGGEASWCFYPFAESGFHTGLGSGALVAFDQLNLALPGHRLVDSFVRFGVPFELALGWTLWKHFDLETSYRQIVFATETPRTFGYLQATLGGRL